MIRKVVKTTKHKEIKRDNCGSSSIYVSDFSGSQISILKQINEKDAYAWFNLSCAAGCGRCGPFLEMLDIGHEVFQLETIADLIEWLQQIEAEK